MEENGQKTAKKLYNVTTCNDFWPKKERNSQNQIFPVTFSCLFSKVNQNAVYICKFKKILWPDFEKLAETLIFGQKWQFFTIFTPWKRPKFRVENFCKKVKLPVHTLLTSHHTSKLDHFWAHYLQKMVIKTYNVTTCNLFLTKKGQNGQNQIFPGIFTCFFQM